MIAAEPRFLTYPSGDRDEPIVAHGPAGPPRILIVQPLFEEMNRCRAILADVQRALAAAGTPSWLIDLPGTGESRRGIETVALADWRRAVADAVAAIPGGVHLLSVRGGALLDDVAGARSRWRLAPVDGASLVRELDRAARIGGSGDDRRAGYPLGRALIDGLAVAIPAIATLTRTARLHDDPRPADTRIAAPPPWRRSEPARDPALAAAIAQDVGDWIAACDG